MIEREMLRGLFCRHYGEMFRLARALLYADAEAEDVVQDVFVRLAEADILPAEDKARAYLLTAVRNTCVNRIRQLSLAERAKRLYAIEVEAESQDIGQRMAELEAVCNYADSHLTEPHRSIFRLRFAEGLTLKEIAARLDMNLKTVFKYLGQAIRQVQRQFRH